MVDAAVRAKLDRSVEQRLQAFLLGRVAPQSVVRLCEDLQQEVDRVLPFPATSTCALLSELLIGAPQGGIFPNEDALERLASHGRRQAQKDWLSLTACLRALRNACFHPAAMAEAGDKKRHIDELVERLRRRGEAQAADRLAVDYSFLRSSDIARVAIRFLDELGVEVARRL